MPDWLSILKAYVDTLETAVGAIEGATTLHNKLTAARAALLDQITALRMAELDPANLPADIAAISTTLAHATYGLSAIETLVDDLETDLIAARATLAGMPVETSLFNTTQTTQGATIVLFQLDAMADNIDDIEVEFHLAADGAATFTPTWELTRPGDLVTYTAQLIPAIATIVTPAATGVYRYQVGKIPQGLSGRFRLAQSAAGAANVLCDAACTFKA